MNRDSFTPKHIDHALVAETHPPMYQLHKYWGRKPSNVVRQFIAHYSKLGETVLDPFCGSGVTIIEALRTGRKAIGVDLDPVSIFLTKMTGLKINLEDLKKAFNNLTKDVEKRVKKYYETICPNCKNIADILVIYFEQTTPKKMDFVCYNCGNKGNKKFSKLDLENHLKIEKMPIPYWYPNSKMIPNSRINVHRGMKVSDLFSKRNLIVLSIIYNSIEKIKENSIRDAMKFIFSANVAQASKLLVDSPTSGGSWKIRGFHIPPTKRRGQNPWHYFKNRYNKFLYGKTESNQTVGNSFIEGKNVFLHNSSATDLSFIKDDSVDYIFTDPPYGDSVPYLELSQMWSSWLKFKPNYDDEIIISDSPIRQDKNTSMYTKMMAKVFRELYRVLRPGRWMHLTFHNTDIAFYNIILREADISGFQLEKSVYQPPAVVSAKARLAPYGSASGDYYIRFMKPTIPKDQTTKDIDELTYERIVIQNVTRLLAERGEATSYTMIINNYPKIYSELKKRGFLFSAPASLDSILKKNLNKVFTLVENKWWFKDPNAVPYIKLVPLSERLETTVLNFVNKNITASYDEIFTEIVSKFPNSLTPDDKTIMSVLKDLCEKTKDGKWKLKPSIQKDLSFHDDKVKMIAELGTKAGYAVYADIDGWRNLPDIPSIAKRAIDRIKEIDCFWYDKTSKKIAYHFEVENSTNIHDALIRSTNIPYDVKRIMVFPPTREEFVARRIIEPGAKRLKSEDWMYIRYNEFDELYYEYKKKKEFNPEKLELLHKFPKSRKYKDADMSEFF